MTIVYIVSQDGKYVESIATGELTDDEILKY